MSDLEPIRTDVGVTSYGENFVRGAPVAGRLLLEETRWSLVSRLIDGPELTREDASFLDDVLVAIACPDPRIWPLKLAWLLGAHGDWWAAHGAVTAALADLRMGPWACAAACDTVAFMEEAGRGARSRRDASLVAWARSHLERRAVLWGFGVAGGRGRVADERLPMIDAAVRRHGRADGRFYAAALDGAKVLEEELGIQPNGALAVAAVGLDLGMSRSQVEVVMYQFLGPQILGNAYEAARLAPPALRELPASSVDYVGPPRRRSSRRGPQK